MKEIQGIKLNALSNGAHFTLATNILARAEADETVKNKVKAQIEAFKRAFEAEDAALKLSRKSLLTDEIAKADRERDSFYTTYKQNVNMYLSMADSEFAESARVLAQHIKDYNINTKAQLDDETGLLLNFIDDLEGKFREHVNNLSLMPFVERMKTANEKVRSYTLQRTNERMGLQVGALKKARLATDNAYRLLVKWVNALALTTNEADYADFIDYANTEIEHFKREALSQRVTTRNT